MLNIAIVDDDESAIKNLTDLLGRYRDEEKIPLTISSYTSSELFLNSFKNQYDLLFLDIQMPILSGIELAKQIRLIDKEVAIIFETDFSQYAIMGYKYNAMDYFLKPVSYYDLKMRMAFISGHKTKKSPSIIINIIGGSKTVLVSNIIYVEQFGHSQVFHTKTGEFENVKRRSLASLEKELMPYGFSRCNSSFLVNLSLCTELVKYEVIVEGNRLKISRGMRKKFIDDLSNRFAFKKDS